MNSEHDLSILEKLTDVLNGLGIPYAIGGSLASSVYGTVRFTQDADITVGYFANVADKLYEILKQDFYINKDTMHKALNSRAGFNIIYTETAFKIDVFVQGSSEFDKQLLLRSKKLKLSDSQDKYFSVVSPEDIILLKLRWYEQGGCVSERQWSDVLGILAVQKSLDFAYLREWSKKIGLDELLQRAISESKI